MADLSDLLHGLEVRAPWLSAGRPIMKRAGFVIARGYKNTIRHALSERLEDNQESLLKSGLIEHLVAGEKKIRLLKLRPKELRTLRDWALAKRRFANPLTDAFPGVASISDVRSHMAKGIYSVGTCELEIGISAIFTSTRSFVERVEIPASQLKASLADGYERIVGYKRIYVQTYDSVWLPPTGSVVCVTMDSPLGAPAEFSNVAFAEIRHQIRQQIGRPPEPVNLWPAVDLLYRSTEGKLVDYGFVVGQKQVNHHKARRNTGDLRRAAYDLAGSTAVGDDLAPFKIAIQWTTAARSGISSQPELLLPGVAGDLNRVSPIIDHAFLRDAHSSTDLNFVVSKLLSHIP